MQMPAVAAAGCQFLPAFVPKGTSMVSIATETVTSKPQRPTSATSRGGTKAKKPAKPKGFPLTPNGNGQWSKKISGKVYYFGPWADPDGALKRYLEVAQNLAAGRPARSPESGKLTIRDLANVFLTFKQHKVNTGELTRRTFDEYRDTCERLIRVLGRDTPVERIQAGELLKVREDIAKPGASIKTLANEIGRARVVLNFAWKEGLIDRPIRFGESFKKPGKAAFRKDKANRELERGKMMFSAEDVRLALEHADVHMRAMVLLGINAALGNADCGRLVFQALDLDGGWLDYARAKTGVPRRVPLWPETVAALGESIAKRKSPSSPEHTSTVFITKRGEAWFKAESRANPLSAEFKKLLKKTGIYRKQVCFYALRHTFETVAGQARDQVAVNACMGHVDDSMAANYRHDIDEERLRAVVDHVRTWLFGASDDSGSE
jgi:integrase